MALWRSLLVAAAFMIVGHPALAQTAAPAGAEVYIIYPRDGQKGQRSLSGQIRPQICEAGPRWRGGR